MSKLARFKLTRTEKRADVLGAFCPRLPAAGREKQKMLFRVKADAERKRAELIAATKEDSKDFLKIIFKTSATQSC